MLPRLAAQNVAIRTGTALIIAGLVLFSARSVSSFDTTPIIAIAAAPAGTLKVSATPVNVLGDPALWNYFRMGLNLLEASGEEVALDFVHPGGVAYGPLALTRIAVKDVVERCEQMRGVTFDEIVADARLYERCAMLYADLLLRHYLKVSGNALSREEIFDILQRAWFLGPTLYKKKAAVPPSREERALEFISQTGRSGS